MLEQSKRGRRPGVQEQRRLLKKEEWQKKSHKESLEMSFSDWRLAVLNRTIYELRFHSIVSYRQRNLHATKVTFLFLCLFICFYTLELTGVYPTYSTSLISPTLSFPLAAWSTLQRQASASWYKCLLWLGSCWGQAVFYALLAGYNMATCLA